MNGVEYPGVRRATRDEIRWCVGFSKTPRLRSMGQFACDEIILPNGPNAGTRYSFSPQPCSRLWFEAIDSGWYNTCVALGPTQTGKTLSGLVIPVLYHLVEVGETVVCGVPHMDMAADKWREDFLPVIERTRYRDWLPTTGRGSKGGMVTAIRFKNGATLRFMSGGGDDKTIAGFTARTVAITEVDGMDSAGANSREADRITQILARTLAFGEHRRVYLECTVSIPEGRIWREYKTGDTTRIGIRCPHCHAYVTPERTHLVGWDGAIDADAAARASRFACPDCGALWSEADRRTANREAVLLHKEGYETAPEAGTYRQLGFRWNAANNLFITPGTIGRMEWRRKYGVDASDEENREKELCQFFWATPYVAPDIELTPLDPKVIEKRTRTMAHGVIPQSTDYFTMGIDIGKYQCHWATTTWHDDGTAHIPDYGAFETHVHELGEEKGILSGLQEFREIIEAGWEMQDGARVSPQEVWIDSRYNPEVIYTFCRESGKRYRPIQGYGTTQRWRMSRSYTQPKNTNKAIKFIGDGYHLLYLKDKGIIRAEINADTWKSFVHKRLSTPIGEAGAMTLFEIRERHFHRGYISSLTAERQVEDFVPGRGPVIRWEVVVRNRSHWLDATAYACAAAHFLGARIVTDAPAGEAERKTFAIEGSVLSNEDGRPFLVNQR